MDRRHGAVLLLSIDEQHVARIFSGAKRFELRKSLPRSGFSRVYLFQTGGKGIVGWFTAREVIRNRVDLLWEDVGPAATPKERFNRYFEGFRHGCAIAIHEPTAFLEPLSAQALRRLMPGFQPPLSSRRLGPNHPLARFLQAFAKCQQLLKELQYHLRPIRDDEKSRFTEVVLKEIGRNYDGIDRSFVDNLLNTSDAGADPVGFFTESKEVVSLEGPDGSLQGFSTITYKRGDSAKTGPTILLPEFRARGIGRNLRIALEARIAARGFRKVYCTAPAIATPVVRYLLKSGYTIEAQLRQQYSTRHDEFVFGKTLFNDFRHRALSLSVTKTPARLAYPALEGNTELDEGLAALLENAWFPFDSETALRIAREVGNRPTTGNQKPKEALLLVRGKAVVGGCILLPKRGGSVKGLLVLRCRHTKSVERLIRAAIIRVRELAGRRLYFLNPVLDGWLSALLRSNGFMPEGVLISPYSLGQDVLVHGMKIGAPTEDGMGSDAPPQGRPA